MNQAIVIGRLGNNPEVRYTANGVAVANFRMATNEVWIDKSGNKQQKTEWHRIVVWGKAAETCGKHLSTGRQVSIVGKMRTRKWEDANKVTHFSMEIHTNAVEFLGNKETTQNKVSGEVSDEQSQEAQIADEAEAYLANMQESM